LLATIGKAAGEPGAVRPAPVIAELSAAVSEALRSPELASRFEKHGAESLRLSQTVFDDFATGEVECASLRRRRGSPTSAPPLPEQRGGVRKEDDRARTIMTTRNLSLGLRAMLQIAHPTKNGDNQGPRSSVCQATDPNHAAHPADGSL
jgi:hypothetical protein